MNYLIHIDSLEDKKLFFDFWKLPHTTDVGLNSNASIVTSENLGIEYKNTMVLLHGNSHPQLCHLGNGINVFAKIHRIGKCPRGLEIITPVFDKKENIISYILKDSQRNTVYLPFTLDEVIESFCYEKYINKSKKTFLPSSLLKLYYFTKPIVPTLLQVLARSNLARLQRRRNFPRWPYEASLEDFKRFILTLLLSVSKTQKLPFIWFWPRDKEACLLLTHDVESGLTGNSGISRVISIEERLGFKSSFNIVPFKYEIDKDVINKIKSSGCEIGVHGYAHDARLFSSLDTFKNRIKDINRIANEWDASGFRSCSTYRNPDWYEFMEFDYDCSFFDTDPFEPQHGGCLSLFPYFIGNIVEIPTTMPQDYALFVLLKQKGIKIWQEKIKKIRDNNGLICLIAHPDEGYIGDKDKEIHYIEFLTSLNHDDRIWNPLPRDVAVWWRKRHDAQIVVEDKDARLKNDTPEMCIKWAKLEDGKLEFSEDS